MAYCDETEIRYVASTNRITESADDDKSGTADTNVLERAVAAADQEVYSYLAGRYPTYTPASVTPTTCHAKIRRAAAVLAACDVFKRRLRHPETLRKDELDWLQKVADGDVSLGTAVASDDAAEGLTDDRLRFYRESGPIRDFGEPEAGDVSSVDDNIFLTAEDV